MSYDIFKAECPQCGNTSKHTAGFRVEVDADAVVRGDEMVSLDLVEVHANADMSCLACGFNGFVADFCYPEPKEDDDDSE